MENKLTCEKCGKQLIYVTIDRFACPIHNLQYKQNQTKRSLKSKLGKICLYCDERFIPDGKFQKYCTSCVRKRHLEAIKLKKMKGGNKNGR